MPQIRNAQNDNKKQQNKSKFYYFAKTVYYIYTFNLILIILTFLGFIYILFSLIFGPGIASVIGLGILTFGSPVIFGVILVIIGLIWIFRDAKKQIKNLSENIINKQRLYTELSIMGVTIILCFLIAIKGAIYFYNENFNIKLTPNAPKELSNEELKKHAKIINNMWVSTGNYIIGSNNNSIKQINMAQEHCNREGLHLATIEEYKQITDYLIQLQNTPIEKVSDNEFFIMAVSLNEGHNLSSTIEDKEALIFDINKSKIYNNSGNKICRSLPQYGYNKLCIYDEISDYSIISSKSAKLIKDKLTYYKCVKSANKS